MVYVWEDHTWVSSCEANAPFPVACRIEARAMPLALRLALPSTPHPLRSPPRFAQPRTFLLGLPSWWFFAVYAWSRPENFASFINSRERNRPISHVHDLLLTCDMPYTGLAGDAPATFDLAESPAFGLADGLKYNRTVQNCQDICDGVATCVGFTFSEYEEKYLEDVKVWEWVGTCQLQSASEKDGSQPAVVLQASASPTPPPPPSHPAGYAATAGLALMSHEMALWRKWVGQFQAGACDPSVQPCFYRHDLRSVPRSCDRTCVRFATRDGALSRCLSTQRYESCSITRDQLDELGHAPVNNCTHPALQETFVTQPEERYYDAWADLPEMYLLAVTTMTLLTIMVQWAAMVKTPVGDLAKKEKDLKKQLKMMEGVKPPWTYFYPLMRAVPACGSNHTDPPSVCGRCMPSGARGRRWPHPLSYGPSAVLAVQARIWADFHYKQADRLVGFGVITCLWALTVLPLNYIQSVRRTPPAPLSGDLPPNARPPPFPPRVRCCSSSGTSTVSSSAARIRPICSRSSSRDLSTA